MINTIMINTIWLYSLISVFIVSLISFIGILAIAIRLNKLKKFLTFLVSFAAGAMLGDVFIHLVPEIFNREILKTQSGILILSGLIIFFVMEKIICWRHCHIPTTKNHPHNLALMNLVGDGVHNFGDGVIIAAAYMANFNLGLATTLAVIFHEIPQEIGDFSVLIYAGLSKIKALFYNFMSALTALLGAFITLSIGFKFTNLMDYLLPISAGGFLYIASADLIPELKKEEGIKKSLIQLASLLIGISIMAILK